MTEPETTDNGEGTAASQDRNHRAVREEITSWLVGEGYSVREGQVQDAAWMLVAEDPAQRRFMVGQKTNRPDVVVMQGTVAQAEEHAQRLDGLGGVEREEFLYDLRFRLLDMGLDFQGVSHPLRQVILNDHLYWEDIGRNEFFRTLKRLRHGILAVIWSVGRKLNQPAPTAASGGGAGGAEVN